MSNTVYLCEVDCTWSTATSTLPNFITSAAICFPWSASQVATQCPDSSDPSGFSSTTGCVARSTLGQAGFPNPPGNFACRTIMTSASCASSDSACPSVLTAARSVVSSSSSSNSPTTSGSGLITSSSSQSASQTPSSPPPLTSAQSTSAKPTSSPPPTIHQKSGVSSGAAAGIAVGCLIAGAGLAIAVLLLFCFRSKGGRRRQFENAGNLRKYDPDLATEVKAIGKAANAEGDQYLPQPAEDNAIIGELSRLRDKIKDHAQNFYHTSWVDPQSLNQALLQDTAEVTGVSPPEIKRLLLDPHSRDLAIRLYLACLILSKCRTESSKGKSFLPAEVATFAAVISEIDTTDIGKIALASKWKSISGALLQSRLGQQSSIDADTEMNIAETIAISDSVLINFSNGPTAENGTDKRIRNLEAIMQRAARFAFVLFSQPSSWKFQWLGRTAQNGAVVVFPGLEQTVNDEGRIRSPPGVLSEPEIVSYM